MVGEQGAGTIWGGGLKSLGPSGVGGCRAPGPSGVSVGGH